MPSTNQGKSGKILKFFSKDAQLNTEQSQRKCATVHSRCLLVQYKQYWKEIRSYVALCSLVCYSVIECQKRSEVKISSRCWKQVSALEVVITINRWCCWENNNNKKETVESAKTSDSQNWFDHLSFKRPGQCHNVTIFYTSDDTKHEMQTCANMKYILTGSHLLFLLITPHGGHASIKKHWQMTKTTRRCFCSKLKPITIKLSAVFTLSNRLHAWI